MPHTQRISITADNADVARWKHYANGRRTTFSKAVNELAQRGLEATIHGDNYKSLNATVADILRLVVEGLLISRLQMWAEFPEEEDRIKSGVTEVLLALAELRESAR